MRFLLLLLLASTATAFSRIGPPVRPALSNLSRREPSERQAAYAALQLRGGGSVLSTNAIGVGYSALMALVGVATFINPSGCLQFIGVEQKEAARDSSIAYTRFMAAYLMTTAATLVAGASGDPLVAAPVALYGSSLSLLASIPDLDRLGCLRLPLVVLIVLQALVANLTHIGRIDGELTLFLTVACALLNGAQFHVMTRAVRAALPFFQKMNRCSHGHDSQDVWHPRASFGASIRHAS
eukprot:scaffold5655_cov36-Tisochrysis_lutea.AAC.1